MDDDIVAARLMANETAHPRGHLSPMPNEAWGARQPITPAFRAAYNETHAEEFSKAWNELGFLPGLERDPKRVPAQKTQADRIAVSRTLDDKDILFSRGAIFSTQKNVASGERFRRGHNH